VAVVWHLQSTACRDQFSVDHHLAEEKRKANSLHADTDDLFIVYDSLGDGTTGRL